MGLRETYIKIGLKRVLKSSLQIRYDLASTYKTAAFLAVKQHTSQEYLLLL